MASQDYNAEYTFAPKLNQTSLDLDSKRTQEERYAQHLGRRIRRQREARANETYKPQLNSRSVEMVQSTFAERQQGYVARRQSQREQQRLLSRVTQSASNNSRKSVAGERHRAHSLPALKAKCSVDASASVDSSASGDECHWICSISPILCTT
eukprot:m.17569 g.17569  ORF g.17569 m.17569 type:complete len:153 (-) comp10676_c0_seq1:243-701(-)